MIYTPFWNYAFTCYKSIIDFQSFVMIKMMFHLLVNFFLYVKAKPYVCFNKEGTLLAVFADDSKIKILANDIGTQLLQTLPSGSVDSTGRPCRSSGKVSY